MSSLNLLFRRFLKWLAGQFDRKVIYVPPGVVSGVDLIYDLRQLVSTRTPLVLDVGANEGQSVDLFKGLFPAATIHSFEPSRKVFERLALKQMQYSGVNCHNCALGSDEGSAEFINYSESLLSSFLALEQHPENRFRFCEVKDKEIVRISTVDRFLTIHEIPFVDLLKIDTQGYDLEVLKGSSQSLQAGRVGVIQVEINFAPIYHGSSSSFVYVLNLLQDLNYRLVDLYEKERQGNGITWCNALFVRNVVTEHLE